MCDYPPTQEEIIESLSGQLDDEKDAHKKEIDRLTSKMDAIALERDNLASGKQSAKLVSATIVEFHADSPHMEVSTFVNPEIEYVPLGYSDIEVRLRVPQEALENIGNQVVLNMEMK